MVNQLRNLVGYPCNNFVIWLVIPVKMDNQYPIQVSTPGNSLFFCLTKNFIVASEASDLIFKIVIFHDVPWRSSSLYTGFSITVWGWGRRRRREISRGSPNSSKTARYFCKPSMQDGSWLCQTCLVLFISQYLS